MVKENKEERNNDVTIKRKKKRLKRVSSRLVKTRVTDMWDFLLWE